MPAVLGYWKIRGYAQPIRLLLEYVGENYEDKFYESADNWMADKFNIGVPLPNLPYYKDGKVNLSQSMAIMRYIARKYNLMGDSPEQQAYVEMLLDTCTDFRTMSARVFYNKDFETMKPDLVKNMVERFKQLNDYGRGKTWLTGDTITAADFVMYEIIKLYEALEKSVFDDCKWLKDFVLKFEALEAVKKYQASPKYISYPFNGSIAFWGGK